MLKFREECDEAAGKRGKGKGVQFMLKMRSVNPDISQILFLEAALVGIGEAIRVAEEDIEELEDVWRVLNERRQELIDGITEIIMG